jgi:hypothetical protein
MLLTRIGGSGAWAALETDARGSGDGGAIGAAIGGAIVAIVGAIGGVAVGIAGGTKGGDAMPGVAGVGCGS